MRPELNKYIFEIITDVKVIGEKVRYAKRRAIFIHHLKKEFVLIPKEYFKDFFEEKEEYITCVACGKEKCEQGQSMCEDCEKGGMEYDKNIDKIIDDTFYAFMMAIIGLGIFISLNNNLDFFDTFIGKILHRLMIIPLIIWAYRIDFLFIKERSIWWKLIFGGIILGLMIVTF